MNNFINKPTKINKKKKVKLPLVSSQRRDRMRARQRVFKALNRLQSPPDPGCKDCVGACCKQFLVELSKEEYLSGLYEPYAIMVTQEVAERLTGVLSYPAMLLNRSAPLGTRYYLEGPIGDYCPFFNNGCTIYDKRPATCKVYTCVEDSRITDDIKAGR